MEPFYGGCEPFVLVLVPVGLVVGPQSRPTDQVADDAQTVCTRADTRRSPALYPRRGISAPMIQKIGNTIPTRNLTQ